MKQEILYFAVLDSLFSFQLVFVVRASAYVTSVS